MLGQKELLQRLRQQEEEILQEEREAPHDILGLQVWLTTDIASGRLPERKRRVREVERSILLAQYGYRLVREFPGNRRHTIFTCDMERNLGQVTDFYLNECVPYTQGWHWLLHRLADGQKHVLCRMCQEPLLAEIDPTRVMNSTQPSVYIQDGQVQYVPFDKDMLQFKYRSVRGGPRSNPLKVCPTCGYPLSKESTYAPGEEAYDREQDKDKTEPV